MENSVRQPLGGMRINVLRFQHPLKGGRAILNVVGVRPSFLFQCLVPETKLQSRA